MAKNIFSPREAFDENGVKIDYVTPGQGDFDKYYIDKVIKVIPELIPGTEDEYNLVTKVIETKRDIQQVIESQADEVGIDNLLKRFAATGDSSILPPPMNPTDEVLDVTNLPEDNAEYFEYIHALNDKFMQIPVEIRKDMSITDFIQKVSSKDIDKYIESLMPKKEEKQVDKGDDK